LRGELRNLAVALPLPALRLPSQSTAAPAAFRLKQQFILIASEIARKFSETTIEAEQKRPSSHKLICSLNLN
jgi:hypothetical protein